MIFGYVNQALEAVAKLQIKDSSGVEHDLEAVIDTGYTGRLILPADVVARLNLPYLFEGSAVLADGHSIRLPYHEATIV